MKGTKTQKGITLIALIITIVVLMILAVVTINSVKDGGIITHAQNASSSYKEAQIEEEVKLYSMEYSINSKRSMKEETIDAMILVCKETGISPEKLTVHYNKSDNTEYVLYRIDKTTEEEREILENFKHEQFEQEGVKALRGDIDLDGILTQKDLDLLNEINDQGTINGEEVDQEGLVYQIASIDEAEGVDGYDVAYLEIILLGELNYNGGYVVE